jgi:hypothetical protein
MDLFQGIKKRDWLAVAFSILAMAWMVTEGTWSFYGTSGHLESFFDAQAESLLHGRIDVPPDSIRYEAWVRDGKSYGYFGPTPALFRLPLVWLFPEMKGHWSRSSMFAACLTTLVGLWLLLQYLETVLPELRKQKLWPVLRPVFLLAACIGSTQYYILSESKVYQEASAWSASLSLVSVTCLAWYLATPRRRWLAVSCGTAFLAFLARVSTGVGPLVALFLAAAAGLLPTRRLREYLGTGALSTRRAALAALCITLALSAAAWAGLNQWKFGRWLTSQPVELNLEYSKERIAGLKGEIVSAANLPPTLYVYLNPTHIAFTREFPWVVAVAMNRRKLVELFPSAHLDIAADVVGLPAAMPELFFGALAGTILVLGRWGARLRTLRAPLCGAMAGCVVMFLFGFMTIRYLHDLFPWLVIGTAGALAWLLTDGPAHRRKLAAAAFAALTVWSMWTMFALAFMQQRWWAAAIPAERHLATGDLLAASRDEGVSGLVSYWTRWRAYRAAVSFESGNLISDSTFLPHRENQPVARSAGAPPYGARYVMEVPADGQYELSLRYASSMPRQVLLSINGQPVGYVCTVATGGDQADALKWTFGGRHSLRQGRVTLDLTSNGPFPVLQALRLVRVD